MKVIKMYEKVKYCQVNKEIIFTHQTVPKNYKNMSEYLKTALTAL
jgi:hypothetical protein